MFAEVAAALNRQAVSGHWFLAVSCGLVVCRVVPAVCFWFLAAGWCSPPFSFREVLGAAGWGLVAETRWVSVRLRRGRVRWAEVLESEASR